MAADGKAGGSRPMSRGDLVRWYLQNRSRSTALFDMLEAETYLWRPIRLRNPIVFYEGHLPAFGANTLLRKGLGYPPVDPRLDRLFARGIDPDDEASAQPRVLDIWPSRAEVLDYGREVDRRIVAALRHADLDRTDNPLLRNGEAVYALLEHEAMHQETLLYMWHELPYGCKRLADGGLAKPLVGGEPPAPERVAIPAGAATLGVRPDEIAFGWDNEFPPCRVDVTAFEIDVYNVTNRQFLAFVEAGGYSDPSWWNPEGWAWVQAKHIRHPHFWTRRDGRWFWRGMLADIALPPAWPVYVSHAEASAYARWTGSRLPTEAEYHRAAYGTPWGAERPFPWGDSPPDASRGNFDFAGWEPVPVASCPAGASVWGVQDLVGNGWEWTSTPFAGFPGFATMASYPEYSADFFDDHHFVLKGASPATAKELIRRSFRNWFRPTYPYVYATFRTVAEQG